MPIIKSSEAGKHVTTIIFDSDEIAALRHLLSVATFPDDEDTQYSTRLLEELEYGLGICFTNNK
jgi:hypothetical protein